MTPETQQYHIKFTVHGKERIAERVCPHVEHSMSAAKSWVRTVVEEAIERNGFSRKQPDWVQRRWTQCEPEPKGSNVRYLRAALGEARFCIVVGYERTKRKSDPPRWSVITVLPETKIEDQNFPVGRG